MHFKYHLTLIIAVFISLLTTSAVSGNERTAKKFEMAISACEKGLQMKIPKSKGSLTILQNLFKKYQRHRDAALKLDESLKSSEERRYTGSLFVRKTFSEVYQTCEHDFSEKVAMAEAAVKKTAENIEAQQAQQDAKVEKTTAATNQEVVLAIDNYCATYLFKPEGTSSPWYGKYQATKQKVLELYPNIVNQFHATTITEIGTSKPTNLNKTIKAWFDYCDTAFAQPVEPAKRPTASEANPPDKEPSSPGSSATLPQKTTVTTPPQEGGSTPAQPAETSTPSPKAATTTTPASTSASEKEVRPIQTTAPTSSPETTGTTSAPESAPTSPPAINTTTTPPGDTSLVSPTPDKDKAESSTSSPDSSNAKNATSSNNTASPADAEETASANTDNADTDETEYKSMIAKMQGDRLKVLKEEKRLPDFVDDEDYNYQKATIWQYEKADGKKCSVYNFKGNQLVKSNKNLIGECPPLPTKE